MLSPIQCLVMSLFRYSVCNRITSAIYLLISRCETYVLYVWIAYEISRLLLYRKSRVASSKDRWIHYKISKL
jgi:hypothetical protein